MVDVKKIPLWEPPLKEYDHITQGDKTLEFEKKFAEFVSADFAVACTSGTVALFMALKASGIGLGKRVVVPVLTAPGTANAVRLAGATPQFVDVSPENSLISRYSFELADAVIPVHFNGRIVPDLPWFKADVVVEDACHALGNKAVGQSGLACYSFSPTKLIHTGQGGMVTTGNHYLYRRLLALRNQGTPEGYNFKFTDLQAKIGLEYVGNLARILRMKRAVYDSYQKMLQGVEGLGLISPKETETPWLVDIFVENYAMRESLIKHLADNGIETRRFYEPLAPCFKFAEYVSQRGLWLPSSVHLTNEDIAYVCDKIKEFFQK